MTVNNTAVNGMNTGLCVLGVDMDNLVGLEALAEIVISARQEKGLALRPFARLVGVSHGTIERIEKCLSEPQDETLEALAEILPYTYVELKAISQGRLPEDARRYVTAEDVMGVASQLSKEQRKRLIHLLVDYGEDNT